MRREQIVALVIGLFAILFMAGSWNLPRFALVTGGLDAYVFPLALGGLLLFLSLIYFLQASRTPEGKPLMEGVNIPLLLKLMGATAVYALVLGTLGFIVATSLFLAGTMFLLGLRKWTRLLSISLGFSVGVYALFVFVLKVTLAQGIMPF